MSRRQIWWMALGAGAILLRVLLGTQPALIENLYSRGIFLAIRWTIDNLLAWFPLPLIYLFLTTLIIFTFRNMWKWIRTRMDWRKRLLSGVGGVLAFFGGAVFFFLVLWGFNYGRVPVEQQLGLEPKPLSLDELKQELKLETEYIIQRRSEISHITDSAITAAFLPENLERQLRRNLENRLQRYHFPTVGKVRGRYLYPKGIFLRFSSAGLYFPWTGEGHVDPGLHALQIPYVMAHELAHGYGFADEGTCTFWGYLACINSDNPIIAYAGHLGYWRELAADFRRYDPENYPAFRKSLPLGIQRDLEAINESLVKYPDIMPRLRYAAYDAYLKTQGIEEGILNYDRVTMLVTAWRKNKEI
jgi:hypothetical protein